MKKIILFLFLIGGFSNTTFPVIILPHEEGAGTQIGRAIGESLGLLVQGLVARNIRKERERNAQKAYIETVFAGIQLSLIHISEPTR
ncbi:MAG TPA: hypothetical protein ENI08_01620, partial [Candidatus Dependentiae bacterium]|nr:hypothetical protein [Candidatus Dependentiae bacterium]